VYDKTLTSYLVIVFIIVEFIKPEAVRITILEKPSTSQKPVESSYHL